MSYGDLARVAKDIQRILTTDFAQDVIFTPPLGAPITVSGYVGKHAVTLNELGFAQVNSNQAQCTVTEKSLEAKGYITRDSNGDLLNFNNHLITWTDVSNQTKTYMVQKGKSGPDESVGSIVFTLGYYKVGTPPPTRIIYGWKACKVLINLVASPDPTHTQVLGNGDVIPLEYALNGDGTLTVPYFALYPGIDVLTPFIDNNSTIADDNTPITAIYNKGTNKFDLSAYGGFSYGDKIQVNATLPIFVIPV